MPEANDATQQSEPSMEEILASIRKIIADEKTPGQSADAANSFDDNQKQVDEDSDILTLTNVVEDDGKVVQLPKAKTQPVEAVKEQSVNEKPVSSMSEAAKSEIATSVSKDSDSAENLVASSVATSVESSFDRLTRSLRGEDYTSKYAHVAPTGIGARTFDDLAREMLRPLLKEWLDMWLPDTVERLVREEIVRLSRTKE